MLCEASPWTSSELLSLEDSCLNLQIQKTCLELQRGSMNSLSVYVYHVDIPQSRLTRATQSMCMLVGICSSVVAVAIDKLGQMIARYSSVQRINDELLIAATYLVARCTEAHVVAILPVASF